MAEIDVIGKSCRCGYEDTLPVQGECKADVKVNQFKFRFIFLNAAACGDASSAAKPRRNSLTEPPTITLEPGEVIELVQAWIVRRATRGLAGQRHLSQFDLGSGQIGPAVASLNASPEISPYIFRATRALPNACIGSRPRF